MNKVDKLIANVLDKFQEYKGLGSVYCFDKTASYKLAVSAYNKFRVKDKTSQALIVVNSYSDRLGFINASPDDNNYKIISEDYVNARYRYAYKLAIIIGVETYWKVTKVKRDSTFVLAIFNKPLDNEEYTIITRELPMINTPDLATAARIDNISSPVEEHLIGVDVDADTRSKLDEYNKVIDKAITIFGDIDTIKKARVGDKEKNISAAEIRDNIAYNNGWNPDMKDGSDYELKVDELYNPNNLEDLAYQFYDITRARRELVTDYKGKIDAVIKIVKDNPGKKIVIVSKRGEFAAYITECLNLEGIECRDYHDFIVPRTMNDDNGEVITYKTGARAGEPKVFGAIALSKFGLRQFNDSQTVNCLSIKEKSDVTMSCACTIVIFTSSLCDSIVDLRKRFTNVRFTDIPTVTYRIYCNNTIESDKILKLYDTPVIHYIEDSNSELTSLTENNGDVVL